jgi:hypothetical protein
MAEANNLWNCQRGKKDDTHAIPIPNLNDLLIRADNQAITSYLRATFYPGHLLDG